MRAQWALLGVDADRARAAASEDGDLQTEPDEYELPPDLWPAWECFISTWNQWRIVAGLGGVYYDGIDHTSLASTMGMLGINKSRQREVFMYVRILENEARPLRNERD